MKLGNYAYPDVSLSESIKDAKKIYDRFKDEEVDSKLVSETIGYSGGSFSQRLSALRKYGLVTPRGKVKVTDLGKKITYPSNRDAELSGVEEAIMNVELFQVLYNKFDVELPKEKFWVNLVNITNAEAPDAQAKEDTIRQIYMDSVSPLVFKREIEKKEVPSEKISEVGKPDFFIFKTDDFIIQIRKDLKTFDFVKTRLMESIMPLLEYEEGKIKAKEKKDKDG